MRVGKIIKKRRWERNKEDAVSINKSSAMTKLIKASAVEFSYWFDKGVAGSYNPDSVSKVMLCFIRADILLVIRKPDPSIPGISGDEFTDAWMRGRILEQWL